MIQVDEEDDDDIDIDSVQTSFLNAENDRFGEPQDEFLDTEDIEVEPDEETTLDELRNDEPLDDSSSPGPSTRKKRRISNSEEVENGNYFGKTEMKKKYKMPFFVCNNYFNYIIVIIICYDFQMVLTGRQHRKE